MKRIGKYLLAPAYVLICSQACFAAVSNCYVILEDTTGRDIVERRALIEAYGARIIHEFPPNEYICQMSASSFRAMEESGSASGHHLSEGRLPSDLPYGASIGQRSWQHLLNIDQINNSSPVPPDIPFVCGTSGFKPTNKSQGGDPDRSVSRREMYSTEFLIGKTAVAIVLPQSNSDIEQWSSFEEQAAVSQVIMATENISAVASSWDVDVSWVYEVHSDVPVEEEPIQYVRPDWQFSPDIWVFGWMGDILDYFDAGSEWHGIYEMGN